MVLVWVLLAAQPAVEAYQRAAALVDRRDLEGARRTVEEALRAYTSSCAYAEFSEREKGTLEPGKLTDVVVLDRDIFTIKPEEIQEAIVLKTIVGGNVVYERQ